MIDIFNIVRNIKGSNFNEYKVKMQDSYLNALDEDNMNLLQAAIAYNQDEIALDLINKGIDVNNQNTKGQTALHFCATHHKFIIAEAILKNGGDVNIMDVFGNNSLWTSTMNAKGKYLLVELYLKFGGDPMNKNNNNKSSLDFANQIKDQNLISLLELDNTLNLNS